jgi:ADP-ribose pyrophosphatase
MVTCCALAANPKPSKQVAENSGSRWTRLGRDVIYQSPWVNLYADKVKLPQGQIIERFHLLDFEKECVAAVVQSDSGEILMVEVLRYVSDSVEWEVPAGMIDKGEEILPAAQREVREESGYETTDVRHLCSFNPENGMSNRTFHVAHCRATGEPGDFDGNEIQAVYWKSIEEVRAMIRNQQIRDGFSLTALLFFLMDEA